jgi:hypothetical protein
MAMARKTGRMFLQPPSRLDPTHQVQIGKSYAGGLGFLVFEIIEDQTEGKQDE